MSLSHQQRYFVRQLDSQARRLSPNASYEVQILNDESQGERCAQIDENGDVVAIIHATKGALPVAGHGIPTLVIEAARQRRGPYGEYVNEKGEVVRPSFLPPAT
jgi:hypothetical protein